MKIHAFAAKNAKEPLAPFAYDAPQLDPYEVLLKVTHCGLCHSDIHLIDDDWKKSQYPLVPGHEVIGIVEERGSQVNDLKIGDRVGVSWLLSACLNCAVCETDDTNICPNKKTTCNGHFGGFADFMVADSRFAFPIPDGLDSAHAAPLLCAGATVYAPLKRYCSGQTLSVAIIGIGGLGHLALQFAKALGCGVSAISHSANKEIEAKSFGADHFFTLDNCPKQFDFILSTVQADLEWDKVISLLKPNGTLCFVGRPLKPATIDTGQLISFQKTLTGSSTANRPVMKEMLSFAAKHLVKPQIELFPLKEVNKAIERVKSNQARYRIVLEV